MRRNCRASNFHAAQKACHCTVARFLPPAISVPPPPPDPRCFFAFGFRSPPSGNVRCFSLQMLIFQHLRGDHHAAYPARSMIRLLDDIASEERAAALAYCRIFGHEYYSTHINSDRKEPCHSCGLPCEEAKNRARDTFHGHRYPTRGNCFYVPYAR